MKITKSTGKQKNNKAKSDSLVPLSILLVEDDRQLREELLIFLHKKFTVVHWAGNGKEGLEMVERHSPELVITDIKMPLMTGLEMAQQLKSQQPDTPVIVLTAFSEVDYLIKAIEVGVDRLIRKPLDRKELMDAINHCSLPIMQRKEINGLNQQIGSSLSESLGKSTAMKELFTRINQLACSDFSLILQGETGVGKSYIARLIHKMSKRSGGPLVTIDIGSIPETLVESELFGHKKGAFTGA
ncbi:MAG: sigma-54-dependent Fis family transcriptional regulator, partial [bacterium]|nr:sigma-54-dependent Fis family transcriptional regulator [bacterium]